MPTFLPRSIESLFLEPSSVGAPEAWLLRLVDVVRQTFPGVLRVSLAFPEPDGVHFRLVARSGPSGGPIDQRLPIAGNRIGTVLRTGGLEVWTPQVADPTHPIDRQVLALGMVHVLHVPIASDGVVYGCLNVGWNKGTDFGREQAILQRLATLTAGQVRLHTRIQETEAAAVALRTELQQALERRSRLEAAGLLVRQFTAFKDEDTLLRALPDALAELFPACGLALMLVSAESELEMDVYPLTGVDLWSRGQTVRVDDFLVLAALRSGETLFVDGLPTMNSPQVRPLVEAGFRSGAAVPVQVGARAAGVLVVLAHTDCFDRHHDAAVAEQVVLSLGGSLFALRARAQLAEASAVAEANQRQQQGFLSMMAHELRTPLHAVLASSQLLERQSLPPGCRTPVHTIRTSSEALSVLIDDVLDFSRNQGSGVTLEPAAIQVEELIEEVLQTVSATHSSVGTPPPSDVAVSVHTGGQVFVADPGRVRQVVLNLVSNAFKFSGGGRVRVSVRSSQRVVGLEVSVEDTGPGIPPDRLSSLFEPFFQGDDGYTRRHGGKGLGLAIVRQLIDAMLGHIEVDSTVGVGSRFVVHLPGPLLHPAPAAHPPDAVDARDARLRVLLVDDNPVNLAVGASMLRALDQEVVAVDGADTAYEAYCNQPFDLVLMDLHMPEVDGLEATRRLLGCPGEHAVVVALTADTAPDLHTVCEAAGMVDVLRKPTRMQQLEACIARVAPRRAGRSARYQPPR